MTARESTVGVVALAAAAVAVGVWLSTGGVPDAPAQATCLRSMARGPCSAARALSADAGEDECAAGEMVYRWVEQAVDLDAGEQLGGVLPPGFVAVEGSTVEVPCAQVRRASKALTVRRSLPGQDCLVGEWTRGGKPWNGKLATSKCCGAGCVCAGRCALAVPVVLAGADDTGNILCRIIPEHGSCADGGVP